MFPETHLWYDTCWPLGSQHGSWAIFFHIPVDKNWWILKPGSIVLPLSHSVRPGRCSTGWVILLIVRLLYKGNIWHLRRLLKINHQCTWSQWISSSTISQWIIFQTHYQPTDKWLIRYNSHHHPSICSGGCFCCIIIHKLCLVKKYLRQSITLQYIHNTLCSKYVDHLDCSIILVPS